MGSRYKTVLRILEKWPLDKSKQDRFVFSYFLFLRLAFKIMSYYRDLGQHIRDRVKLIFNTEKGFIGDPTKCDKQCESLTRLTNNHYFNLYKRSKPYSASGLTAEQCNLCLDSESLKIIEEDSKSVYSRIFRR
jgi:hypothetical protein